jgi:hypothetical protein
MPPPGLLTVVPREFLLTMIEPNLRQQPDDTGVCVMHGTVVGTKGGKKTWANIVCGIRLVHSSTCHPWRGSLPSANRQIFICLGLPH